GACRDLEDMTRWFTGAAVTRVPNTGPPRGEALHDPAKNPANPALGLLDRSKIAIAGNSMGALSVVNYLRYLATGKGADGRSLPPLAAAISLSGMAPTAAVVPIQFQTSDYDGSPALVGP